MKLFITWRKKKETQNENIAEITAKKQIKTGNKIKKLFIDFSKKIKSNQKVALASVLTLSLIAFSLCTVSYFSHADNNVFYASDFVNDPSLGYANVVFEYGEYPQSAVHDDALISRIEASDEKYNLDDNGIWTLITYDGNKYWRNDVGNSYTYYYVEPIKWRILSIDGDEVFAVSEYILSYKTPEATDLALWSGTSSFDYWLNDTVSSLNIHGFCTLWFNNEDIYEDIVEKPYANDLNGDGTGVNQKFTLLSYDDLNGTMGENYGFVSDPSTGEVTEQYTQNLYYINTNQTNRVAYYTDWASSLFVDSSTPYCQNHISSSPNYGDWPGIYWMRSYSNATKKLCYISSLGNLCNTGSDDCNYGIRPAATFKISKLGDRPLSIFYAAPRKTSTSDKKRLLGYKLGDGPLTSTAPEGLTFDNITDLKVNFDDGTKICITYDGNGATSGTSQIQAVDTGNYYYTYIKDNAGYCDFEKEINVSFKSNGVGEDPDPFNINCTFDSWNTNKAGTGTKYVKNNNVPHDKDYTIYAIWKNSTSIILPTLEETEESGAFLGWYNAADRGNKIGDGGDSFVPPAEDVILYAHWENDNSDILYASDLVTWNEDLNVPMGYMNVFFEYGEYPQTLADGTSGLPEKGKDYEIVSLPSGKYMWRREPGLDTGHWYKYEPIKWRILQVDNTNSEVFAVSEFVLDAQRYEDTLSSIVTWPNNPTLRQFLNGQFYDMAFANCEKPLSKMYVNTNYWSDNSLPVDKVTILGDAELSGEWGSKFGFLNATTGETKTTSGAENKITTEFTNRIGFATDLGFAMSNKNSYGTLNLSGSSNNGKHSVNYWTPKRSIQNVPYINNDGQTNCSPMTYLMGFGVRPAITLPYDAVKDLPLTIRRTGSHDSAYSFGGYTFNRDEINPLDYLYERLDSSGGLTLKNLPYLEAHFGKGTFDDQIRVFSSPSTRIVNDDGTSDQADGPEIYAQLFNSILSRDIPDFDISEYLRENGDIKLNGNHDLMIGMETAYTFICDQLQVFMFSEDGGNTSSGDLKLNDSYYWKDHEWLEDSDGNKLYELHYGTMDFTNPNDIKMTYTYQGDLAGTDHKVYKVHNGELDIDEYYIDDPSNGTWNESQYRWAFVRPKYAIQSYTVNFDANTGRGKMKSQTIKFEDNDSLNANKFKKGVEVSFKGNGGELGLFDHTKSAKYKFAGWTTNPDGTGDFYENRQALGLTSEDGIYDITLYAKWDTASDDVTLPKPTRSGYDFTGWYTSQVGGEKIGEDGETFTPLSDTILYAHWAKSGTTDEVSPDIFYASDFVNDPELGYVNMVFEYGSYPQRVLPDTDAAIDLLDRSTPDENGIYKIPGGSFVKEGGKYYMMDPIKWRILSIDDVNGEVTAIAENVLECKPWDDQITTDKKWSSNPSIREWLNNDFFDAAFKDDEKDAIISKYYSLGDSNLDGDLIVDKVSLLSIDDLSGDKGVKLGFVRDPAAAEDTNKTNPDDVKVLSEYTNRNAIGTDFAVSHYADWLTKPTLNKATSLNNGKVILNWWTKSRKDEDETRAVFGDGSCLSERQSDTMLGVRPVVTFDFNQIKGLTIKNENITNNEHGKNIKPSYIIINKSFTNFLSGSDAPITVNSARVYKYYFYKNESKAMLLFTSPSLNGFYDDGTRYHFDTPLELMHYKLDSLLSPYGADLEQLISSKDYLRNFYETNIPIVFDSCPNILDGFPENYRTRNTYNEIIMPDTTMPMMYNYYDLNVLFFDEVENVNNILVSDLKLSDDYEWEGHDLSKNNEGEQIYEVFVLNNGVEMSFISEIEGTDQKIYYDKTAESFRFGAIPTSTEYDFKIDDELRKVSLFIRPKFDPTDCIIHFDSNGGKGTMPDQTINVKHGGTFNENEFTNGFSVEFKPNGGTLDNDKKIAVGGPVFTGWNTMPDKSGTHYDDKAEFTPDVFELTLYAEWGTSEDVTLPLPTKEGATFTGWYTAPVGGTKIGMSGESYSPTCDSLLYAHWNKTGTTKEIKPNIFYAGDLSNNPEYGYVNATFEYGEYPSKLMSDSELAADDNYLALALHAKFTTDDYEISTSPLGYIISITNKDDESKIDKYFYGIDDRKTYKYEPIKWRVLSIDYTNGEVFALAENVLDATTWDSTSADQKWSDNPPIRQFVNDTFYNRAFSDEEKENIITKVYPLYDEGMEGTEINDRVTLLAYEEVSDWGDPISFKYGFSNYKLIGNDYSWSCDQYNNSTKIVTTEYTNRNTTPTDYAAARGDFEFTFSIPGSPNNGKIFADWWLKSRYDAWETAQTGVYGPTDNENATNWYGVRPAITFDLDAIKDKEVTINQVETRGPNYKIVKNELNKPVFTWKSLFYRYDSLENILNSISSNDVNINLFNLKLLQGNFYKGDNEVSTLLLMPWSTNSLQNDGTRLGISSPEIFVEMLYGAYPSLKGEYDTLSEYLKSLGLITMEDHDDLTLGYESLYSMMCNRINCYLSTNDDLSVTGEVTLEDSYVWEGRDWAEDADGNKLYELHLCTSSQEGGQLKYTYSYKGDVVGTKHTVVKVPGENKFYFEDKPEVKWSTDEHTLIIVRPKFLPNETTIHFDANGGSGTMDDQTISYDEGGNLNDNEFVAPSKTVTFKPNGGTINETDKTKTVSLVFDKWNTKPDGSGTSFNEGEDPNFDPNDLIINLDLYAIWKQGASGITLPVPSKSGYTFTGWYTKAEGGEKIGDAGANYSPLSDITLYAHWKNTSTNKEFKPQMFYASDLANNPDYGYVNATFEYGEYPSKLMSDSELAADDNYLALALHAKFTTNDYEISYSPLGYIISITNKDDESKIDKYFYGIDDRKTYKYEPIKWRVLSIDYTNGEVFAIAENVLDCQTWDDDLSTDRKWSSNPPIRQWLNGDFLNNAFSIDEQDNIIQKYYTLGSSNYDGTLTSDKVTLLSYDEMSGSDGVKYGFVSDPEAGETYTTISTNNYKGTTEYTNRMGFATDYAFSAYSTTYGKLELDKDGSINDGKVSVAYWTKSRRASNLACNVNFDGHTYTSCDASFTNGVRPVVTFDFDAVKDLKADPSDAHGRDSEYKIEYTYSGLSNSSFASLNDSLRDWLTYDFAVKNLEVLKVYFYKGNKSYFVYIDISGENVWINPITMEHFEYNNPNDMYNDLIKDDFEASTGITYDEYAPFTQEEWCDLNWDGDFPCFASQFGSCTYALLVENDGVIKGEFSLPGEESYRWDGRTWAEDVDGNKLYEIWYVTLSPGEGSTDEERYNNMKPKWKLGGTISGDKHTLYRESHPSGNIRYYIDDKDLNGSWLDVNYNSYNTDAYSDIVEYESENRFMLIRPKFLPNSNKITLNLEGGEGTESIYTDKEETGFFQDPGCKTPLTDLKITIPEKAGYKFEGFFSEENGGGTKYINSDGTFTSNFEPDSLSDGDELYAYWSVITYTINYVLNGATNNTSNPSTYTIESSDITIGEPQLSGYSFLKWTGENLEDNTKSFVIPSGSTGNRTYTAVFDVDTYQIDYHLASGETVDPANPATYTVLTDTFKLNNPVKEHYTFTGWTGANGITEQTDVSVDKGTTGNLDFYPHFSPVNYQITFDSNGGSSVDPKSVAYGSEIGTLPEPTRSGYTFKGWFRDNTTFSDEVLNADTMSGNFTAYAKWEIITYTITYHLDGGELAIGKTNPTTYTVETPSFTLENPTKAGYAFDGWHLDGYLGAMKPVVIHTGDVGDRDYTAKYSIRKFNLTFDSNGGTSVTSKKLDYNSQFGTLDAPTKNGYTFKGWFFDDDTFQNEATSASLITDDTELHAKWEATTYQITYSGLEDATVSGNPTSYTIESGQIVLSAPTKVGYDFEGWTGSNGTTKQINVTIPSSSTGDKSYVACWKVKQLTVGFDSNGGSNIISKTLSYGDTLGDLTIPTKDRALFAGWYKDAMFQNKVASTDTILDNMTLHALWYDVAPIDPEVYCASQIKPSLTVIDSNSNTINVPNADVTVTYGVNINAGEGTVTLTGFGNSKEIKFKINKKIITRDDIKIADSDKEIVKYKNGTVNTKTNVDVTPFVKLASCNNEEVILNYSECFISDTSGNPITRTTRKDKTVNYDNIKVSGLSVSNSNYQLEPLLTSKIFEGYSQLVDNTVPKLEEILVINSKKMKKGDTLKVSVRFTEELDLTSDIFNQIKDNFVVRFDLGDEKDKELKLDSYTLVNSKTVFNFTFQIPSDLEDEKEFALTNFNFIQLSGDDLKDIAQNILDLTQTGITLPSGYYVSTKKETPVPSGGGGGGGGAAGPVYTVLPVDDSIKVNKSYMNGYENKTFRPNDPVSREEVAAIVARLDGEFSEDFNFTSFNDFEDALNRWSKNYIGFCKYKDLFHGYEDGSFHPTSFMTRAELATLVSNFLRVQNADFEKVDLTKPAFSDVDGRWYEESVNKLAHLGILNGYEDGTFKGDNPVSRIEVAIVMNKINKKIVPDDKTFKTVKKEIAKKFKDIKEGTWYFNDVVMATMDYETKLVKTDTSKK